MSSTLPRFCRAELADPHADVLAALRKVARDGGAFRFADAVDPRLVQGARDAASRFFASPLEDRLALSAERAGGIRGYRPLPEGNGDLKEWFFFTHGIPEDEAGTTPLPGGNVWPNLPGFRDAVLACSLAMHAAGLVALGALAKAVGLPEEAFGILSGGGLRVLRYPPAEARRLPEQWGAQEHTDMTPFALIADDTPGFECLGEDGAWTRASLEPGELLCQAGDLLARWTGDALRPAPHRVALSEGRARLSFCLFMLPPLDATIPCLETSLDAPFRHYEPITFGDYMKSCAEAVQSVDATRDEGRAGKS